MSYIDPATGLRTPFDYAPPGLSGPALPSYVPPVNPGYSPIPFNPSLAQQAISAAPTSPTLPGTSLVPHPTLYGAGGAGGDLAEGAGVAGKSFAERLGYTGSLGERLGALKSPAGAAAGVGPAAASILGQIIEHNTRSGTTPHRAGRSLSLAGLAGGAGLLGATVFAPEITLPAVLGTMAFGGGAGWLSGAGPDNRPMDQHKDTATLHGFGNLKPHTYDQVVHLLGIAGDQMANGNITPQAFKQLQESASISLQLADGNKELEDGIIADLHKNITDLATQGPLMRQQKLDEARQQQMSIERQAAIAKILQPYIAKVSQGGNALYQSEQAMRGSLSPAQRPISDLIAQQTQQDAQTQASGMLAGLNSRPQIEALLQAIQDQNQLQAYSNAHTNTGGSSTLQDQVAAATP